MYLQISDFVCNGECNNLAGHIHASTPRNSRNMFSEDLQFETVKLYYEFAKVMSIYSYMFPYIRLVQPVSITDLYFRNASGYASLSYFNLILSTYQTTQSLLLSSKFQQVFEEQTCSNCSTVWYVCTVSYGVYSCPMYSI